MTLPTKTPAWFFQNRVTNAVDFSLSPSGTFRLGEISLPSETELSPSELFVQTLYLGNDPGQLLRISAGNPLLTEAAKKSGNKLAVFPTGSPMWAFSVSRVLKVGGATNGEGDGKFKEGDLVVTVAGGWVLYSILEKSQANVVQ